MNQALATVAALIAAFVAGVWYEKDNTAAAASAAVTEALKTEAKRTEEVINGWAGAVNYLRARIRNGDAPRIPVPAPPGTGAPPGGTPGTPAPGVPPPGELETCRAERKQLIEDGADTMIKCRALQQWAK